MDFKEPKNNIGQTPLDQCMDAYYETIEENIEIKDDMREGHSKGVQAAIEMWQLLQEHEEKNFKKWTLEEIETFCEEYFIESPEWLQQFIGESTAHIEMCDVTNHNGDLIIIIKSGDGEDSI